jgi:hypothetical protein
MQEQDPRGDRDAAIPESSDVETNMRGVGAITGPTIHTKTRIEPEPRPERCLDEETGNALATLSTTGENSRSPPVKVVSQ